MEKRFSLFEQRRRTAEEMLELIEELDRILLRQQGPYVQERHEQLQRRLENLRAEIGFLREAQSLAGTVRRRAVKKKTTARD